MHIRFINKMIFRKTHGYETSFKVHYQDNTEHNNSTNSQYRNSTNSVSEIICVIVQRIKNVASNKHEKKIIFIHEHLNMQ